MTISDKITAAAQANGISPAIALAVAQRESGLDQGAVGTHGEIGIFQLMPATAAGLGVDPSDVDQNISGGVRFLADMIGQFGLPGGLYAYNWGSGNVQAWFAGRKRLPAGVKAYGDWVLQRAGMYSSLAQKLTPDNSSPSSSRATTVNWPAIAAVGAASVLLAFFLL